MVNRLGFFWLSACMVEAIIARIQSYLEQGHRDIPYEDAIRDVMGAPSGNRFSFEDITGLPWIEIDFADDIQRARRRDSAAHKKETVQGTPC